MDVLKDWVLCITLSSLVGAVVYAFTPKGNMQKAIRVIVGVFFICALLTPFINGREIEIDFKEFEIDAKSKYDKALSKNIDDYMLDITKQSVENEVLTILNDNEIYSGQILLDMDIDDENSIFIKMMTIYLTGSDMHKKDIIVDCVSKKFQIVPQIKEGRG
ncbi:MAG: stage III sporulation protein AF [Oscillospiraceae bacterium]|jgi:hypothetical protein|nr:stage III sporulation protein AF [Oscillospiraceae bacterium]